MKTMAADPDTGAGTMAERVRDLQDRYSSCDLCAHLCDVDRTAGEIGACQVDETARIGSYGPHHGEEAPLRGTGGSGTIFLAHCNLACVFCQNFELSQEASGARSMSVGEIADIALSLQDRGCHNVNFVTPTHHSPTLAKAVLDARSRGLEVPVVWNCGGYERAEIIRQLDGIVDIYMPDVKWAEDEPARKYSKAPSYWDAVRPALAEMHRQVGDLAVNEDGVATSGMLIRHLVMPGQVENSKAILDFIAEELSRETYVNIMGQYRPANKVGRHGRYGELDRRVTSEEYRAVVDHAKSIGLTNLDIDRWAL